MRGLLLLLLFLAAPAAAQDFPKLTGRVVDTANIIPPADEAALTQKLEALETASSRQLVIATVPSLQGYDIADYGYQLGRTWGIGQKEANNGIILLVAPNERKGDDPGRLRPGADHDRRALPPDHQPSRSSRGSRPAIIPAASTPGADAIVEQLRAPPEQAEAKVLAAQQAQRQRGGDSDGGSIFPLIFWGIVFMFVILPMMRGGRRGRRHRRSGVWVWGSGPRRRLGRRLERRRLRRLRRGAAAASAAAADRSAAAGRREDGDAGVQRGGPHPGHRGGGEGRAQQRRRDRHYRRAPLGRLSRRRAALCRAGDAAGADGRCPDPAGLDGLGAGLGLRLERLAELPAADGLPGRHDGGRLPDRPFRLRLDAAAHGAHSGEHQDPPGPPPLGRAVQGGHREANQGPHRILLYLSLLEHRAEIVADEAIHGKVEPDVWGEAMAALVEGLKAGRPGEGMAGAVEKIGDVLAQCLPPTLDNPNELPDRLIEL
jgi:uncharacterized protein